MLHQQQESVKLELDWFLSFCYTRALKNHANQQWKTEKNPIQPQLGGPMGVKREQVGNETIVKDLEILVLVLFIATKR